MVESRDDKDVDALIADVRAAVDRLEQAQRKDVKDESDDEIAETPVEDQPKTLREATVKVRAHFRRAREKRDSN